MKTTLALIACAAALASGCATGTASAPKANNSTEVVFDHPEKFTDVKDGTIPTDKGRDAILGLIREFIVSRASQEMPDGYHLKITFTDIDLAGDFEPWRGPNWEDVRIVKPIYPPAFKFTYLVTDKTGAVIKQGSEDIRDLTFQERIAFPPDDPLRFDKDVLNDWIRGNLRSLGKT
jgi:hypothetical protein